MQADDFKQYAVFSYSPDLLDQKNKHPKTLGNEAAVVLLKSIPSEQVCLLYAQYFAESTSVYIAPKAITHTDGKHFDIAWYNSTHRIKRCGHGTLAAAKLLHQKFEFNAPLFFDSSEEQIIVTPQDNVYTLQLDQQDLIDGLNTPPIENAQRTLITTDQNGYCIVDIGSEDKVKDFVMTDKITTMIGGRALIITSLADNPYYDIIFRYFAPQYGVLEDQATGSAGACLWPFWVNHSQNGSINCYQASTRGGFFRLSATGHTINVSGYVTEK